MQFDPSVYLVSYITTNSWYCSLAMVSWEQRRARARVVKSREEYGDDDELLLEVDMPSDACISAGTTDSATSGLPA
jgi:hypothetical protein